MAATLYTASLRSGFQLPDGRWVGPRDMIINPINLVENASYGTATIWENQTYTITNMATDNTITNVNIPITYTWRGTIDISPRTYGTFIVNV